MRFESQTHPYDDHIDRITDCSSRYSQAPAVALTWDWPREDDKQELYLWKYNTVRYMT